MAGRLSSGLLLWRMREGRLEVLLGHMGGPFWSRREAGAWSIPKGEHEGSEDSLAAARREFSEETGASVPAGEALDLGVAPQSSGKLVHGWALEGDLDAAAVTSNTFALEWPPGSGATREFPEIDRAAWLPLERARELIVKGQLPLLQALERRLESPQAGRERGARSSRP